MSDDDHDDVPCPKRLGCNWTAHGQKHFPHKGMNREHTKKPNPARYLPGTTEAQIRGIETTTVRQPSRVLAKPPGKSEYLRTVATTIGWDDGKNADISFAECSGGVNAGRSYHGRPMGDDHPKLKKAKLKNKG